jgi:hypothetical protein
MHPEFGELPKTCRYMLTHVSDPILRIIWE